MSFLDIVMEAKKKKEPKKQEETTEEENDGGDLPEDDGEPEDMTAEDPDAEGGDADGGDLPPEDGEPEDMTGEDPDAEGDSADDTSGGDMEEASTDDIADNDPNVARNNRLLLEDYVNLYFKTKDFILKLNTLDKSNIIVNQVVNQIDNNLSRLRAALWDYVNYDFDKSDYVANMFKYNQFIEVFKTNLEMLTLTREHIFKDLEESTEKPKKSKKKD